MKVGELFLIPTPDPTMSFAQRYDNVFEMVEFGDGHGFDSVWFTEHHFSDYGYSPNPLMLLQKAAEVAPHLRLGTAILVLPLWHPIRLAEDIATLDVLSGGRVDLGIGRGYQPYEFNSLGVDLSLNRDMFNESLKIITESLATDDYSYDGRYWQVPETTVFPKPIQQPHPPIWMAATSPPSIRSAVENGYHLCTGTGGLVDELKMRNAFIDVCAERAGVDMHGIERAANRFVFCSENPADISEAIDEAMWQIRVSRVLSSGGSPHAGRNDAPTYEGEPDKDAWQERMIIGDPDECLRRINELAEAGITYIFGLFQFGGLKQRLAMDSIRLFDEHVRPKLSSIEAAHVTGSDLTKQARAFTEGGPGYVGV